MIRKRLFFRRVNSCKLSGCRAIRPRHCVPRKHPDDSERKKEVIEIRKRKGCGRLGYKGMKEEGFESKSSE